MPLTAASAHWPRLLWVLVLFALLSLGEARLLQRLLFVDQEEYGFVLANVEGVLTGRPVSKSWQQRWFAPLLVTSLDRVTGARLKSLKLFGSLMLVAANLLLFAIARRRGNDALAALAIVAAFGFVHFLLLYKLEYPWDAIDILLMLSFGYAASRGVSLLRLWPLLLVGLFNHETILYVPLFYLLAAATWPARAPQLKAAAIAVACLAALSCAIYALREHFYLGHQRLPGETVETPMPVVENHLHIAHNLRQWWWFDFREGRSFISLSLTAACIACLIAIVRGVRRTAALWTLIVIASIVCFGYVNETRHYLLLVAFWFAYACPKRESNAASDRAQTS